MNSKRVRFCLMFLFLLGLALQLGAFFIARAKMWPEDFNALLVKLLTIYSVQLSIVLGGLFSQAAAPNKAAAASLGWTALALVALWNGLLVWRSLAFSFAERDSVNDLTQYLDSVGAGSAFLVAGAVSFYFGKSASAQ